MHVTSLLSSARALFASVLTLGVAGVAQASGVYWSVDIDVPVERHGRIGTVVSNTPGGVHRTGYPVVITQPPVVVHQPAPRHVHAPRQVVYVPVVVPPRHAYGRPYWAGKRHQVVHHHHYHGDDRRGHRSNDRRGDWHDDRDGRYHRH